ncbi:MAG: hypothetical protein AAF547_11925 [Actinomycetota bacterium]
MTGDPADPDQTMAFTVGNGPDLPPPVRTRPANANPEPDPDQLARFGGAGPEPDAPPPLSSRAPKPQILAPQASEWETNRQEVEVVKGNRVGLVLLFLLALLVVAVVALGLAARSVFGGGSDADLVADGTDTTADDGAIVDQTTTTLPTTTTVDPATQLLVAVTEDPFICDGSVRQFAMITGATPGEQVAFTSPQSSGIQPGTAAEDGTLAIRWQCDPEQVGTTWELTATGAQSGKSVQFSFTGADADGSTATTVPSTTLEITLIEDPFRCDGETRIFGGLSGADANEQIAFSSPQSSGIQPGMADANGELSIRWNCDASQIGTEWQLTATGVTSGRSVTFTFTGS